jgi:hypothetical protein
VLIIHHTGHNVTERPRGSSAMRANLDYMLGVHRDEKEMLATLSCLKQKDGEAFKDTTFALTPYRIWAPTRTATRSRAWSPATSPAPTTWRPWSREEGRAAAATTTCC